MDKKMILNKKYKDILNDVSDYTIKVSKKDTGEDSSLFLLNVQLTPKTELIVADVRKQIEALQSQINTLETTPLTIDIVLPAILQKVDFSKVEVADG